jgi:hypothetical protein
MFVAQRAISVVCLYAALLVVLLGSRSSEAAPPTVELEKRVESAGAVGRPWIVYFVFDKSGSMLRECAEDPKKAQRRNWDVVVEDAVGKLSQLRAALGSFDLRLYDFGNAACEFERPLADRTFSINGEQDVADLSREIAAIPFPKNGEQTNLWNSIGELASGIEESRAGATYGGVVLVVFSDGDDAINSNSSTPESRRLQMLRALESARKGVDIRISVLPIGEWKRNPEGLRKLGAIGDVAELGEAIKVPAVVTYSVAPAAINLDAMPEANQTTEVPVRLRGFTAGEEKAITATLRDAPAGLKLDGATFQGDAGTLRFRATQALERGASAIVDLRFRSVDGVDGGASLRAAVPAFRKVAPVDQWGIPAACSALGGKRVAVLRVGKPLELALSAPTDARVTWTIAGRGPVEGATIRVSDLPPGLHPISVRVATADESRSADMAALVIDPTMTIESPTTARAGDLVQFKSKTTSLPSEVQSRLSAPLWTVRGSEVPGGDAIESRFDRKGSERVSVRRSLDLCGQSFDFAASAVLEIKPGPALRLIGGEVVRGRESRIEAYLSGLDDISKVLFIVNGETIEANIDPASGDRPATAWIKRNFQSGSSVTVRAVPILKDDRGVDRSVDDPECAGRAQARAYAIVDPDVSLVVEAPVAGASLPFAIPVDLRIVPSGRDADGVARIDVALKPASGLATSISLQRSANWAASFTPASEMGSSLEVAAQAFDAAGPVGAPVRFIAQLAAAKPALRLVGAASTGTLSWEGRNAVPPFVSAMIVTEGTERPYATAEIRDIEWSASDGGLVLDSKSESPAQANFAAKASGIWSLRAKVKTADGRGYDLTADVAVRPIAVVPAPKVIERDIAGTSEVRIDHSATKGAWSDVLLRGKRSDGEWRPLVNGGFDAAPRMPEPAEVEAWYRPWGAPASATPWDGAAGWVRSDAMQVQLFPPHSAVLITAAILVALVLSTIAGFLCMGHEHWGAEAMWTSDYSDEPQDYTSPQRIGLRSGTYNPILKRATVPVTPIEYEEQGPYAWVLSLNDSARKCRPAVRFGPSFRGLQYRGTDRQTTPNFVEAIDHPVLSVCLSVPSEYEKPKDVRIPQKKVYLRLEEVDGCKYLCNTILPFIVFPAIVVALVSAVAYLIHNRLI